MESIWSYPTGTSADLDLVGYKVEATDGHIGEVDEASYDADAGYIVVDTGPWIFGKHVLLPAGVIDRIDFDEETVYVNRPKDEIKAAPEFERERERDAAYRDLYGGHYGPGGLGGPGVV
ncbi:MAG: PRC-barrel domain containing protein [Euzebyales bacterium]|jgi:hypothetical protein|nr:PRC-barrel domain containing protein [Euzebyales bacterium]